jgi:hypothetical protein
MRYPASEKLEIIRLVEQSHLPVRRELEQIGIPRGSDRSLRRPLQSPALPRRTRNRHVPPASLRAESDCLDERGVGSGLLFHIGGKFVT